ncbi:acetate/propionate family kinase [Novosphingobium sp. P6W]|uniref:acetate/propionate family kinase n=1 Tax=Novosphingobium sp. P6W TaxID=1609758 RepID=UPI0005C2FC70|nr:acetate kinase [Novosphingobium sp. P6W]
MIAALATLNTGSSSLKFRIFARHSLDRLMAGKVTGIGGDCRLVARVVETGEEIERPLPGADQEAALAAVIACIDAHDDGWHIEAFAHRIVHGGQAFTAPVVVTPHVLAELEALCTLAPLHQPYNLAGIAASARLAPDAYDVACFDTAFHAGHDPVVHSFALPAAMREAGVRRYGFHGISYEWIARVLAEQRPALAQGRVIAAHLGNGASLCAMRGGVSIDTTMGMTALDGLPMGSRSGALDAGAVTYMMRRFGLDADHVDRMLYEDSGLKGLSGLTNDVAALSASADPRAAFALEYFCHRAAQFAAAMAVSLGGVDGIVFTGGIGENAAPLRARILEHLAFLGPVESLVIPADEERMMAIHASDLLETLS